MACPSTLLAALVSAAIGVSVVAGLAPLSSCAPTPCSVLSECSELGARLTLLAPEWVVRAGHRGAESAARLPVPDGALLADGAFHAHVDVRWTATRLRSALR